MASQMTYTYYDMLWRKKCGITRCERRNRAFNYSSFITYLAKQLSRESMPFAKKQLAGLAIIVGPIGT